MSRRSPEAPAHELHFGPEHAVRDMVIDQPHCLHEGIHRGESDEFPGQLFQIIR